MQILHNYLIFIYIAVFLLHPNQFTNDIHSQVSYVEEERFLFYIFRGQNYLISFLYTIALTEQIF